MSHGLIVALLIIATLEHPADPSLAIEALREAAIRMGCERPAVSARWAGRGKPMQVEVRCLDDEERKEEAKP